MREILKAVLKTGSGTVGFLLFGVLATKIMAVILGPSGIGLYSLLRQTVEFSKGLGTLGGETALVQGLASRKGETQDNYLVTAFWVFVLGALLTVTIMLSFAPWLAPWVLDRSDEQAVQLVRWLVLPVTLTIASSYLSGVLNGFRAIGMMALGQLFGAAAMALLAYPVSRMVEVGYLGAFIVVVSVSPAVGTAVSLGVALRAGWLAPLLRRFRMVFHLDSLRHFSSLAGTMLVSGLVGTGVSLAVRSLIVRYEGLADAGIFAVAWTLSMTYLMLVLGAFGTYLLPTLSGTSDPIDRVALIQRALRLITLLAVPLITSVIVLKPLVIEVLYSSEFMPALDIIRWMLLGDYLRATSWVLATTALAYADTRVFLVTELMSSVGFLAFAVGALLVFGNVQGIGVGFLLIYIVYLTYYLHYVRSRHQFSLAKEVMAPWVLGLILLVGVSWYAWSDTQVNWVAAPLWISVAFYFSWLSLKRNEQEEILRTVLRQKEA